MEKVFFNAQIQNFAGNTIAKTAFDLFHDKFVKIEGVDFSKIPAKRFFKLDDNKAKAVRKSKEYKEISIENGRNIFSMRLSKPETRRKKFEEGQVLVLIKPHTHYYHSSFNETKKRLVFDVLNEKFIIMTSDKYKECGFNKFGRGSVIELRDGNWSRLGSNKIKFKDHVNDIEMQDIVDEVSENLMTWRYKGKIDRKCARCKKTCDQLEGALYSCAKYTPIKTRKKKEPVEKKVVTSKKTEGILEDLQVADVGTQLEEEIKKVSKRKKK